MPTKLIYISLKMSFKVNVGLCFGEVFLNKNLLDMFINVIIQLSNIYYVKNMCCQFIYYNFCPVCFTRQKNYDICHTGSKTLFL